MSTNRNNESKCLTEHFIQRLKGECNVKQGDKILVALSGGADSVALLRLLAQVSSDEGIGVYAAHLNHKIRGESAKRDADFARDLCERLQIPFFYDEVDVPALARTLQTGMEDAARQARYALLNRSANEIGATYIALAHHVDDQAETVLLHQTRGCAIKGIAAMRYKNGHYIRPLLDVPKDELLLYLARLEQPYCQDETNEMDDADRNKIRLHVMPQLARINPLVSQALFRLSQNASLDEDYFDLEVERLNLDMFHPMVYGGYIPAKKKIGALHPALAMRVLRRCLQKASCKQQDMQTLQRLYELCTKRSGSLNLIGGSRVQSGESVLHVITCETGAHPIETALALNGETTLGEWTIIARRAKPGEVGDGINTQVLDAQMLQGAVLRNRRDGDIFTPLGMSGTQKLKKTLIDAKIDKLFRNEVPLIACAERVLWIVGLKPAADASVTKDTKSGLHLTFVGQLPWIINTCTEE